MANRTPAQGDATPEPEPPAEPPKPPLRADARRNRARVLDVAAEVFATEGLSVPVHEIARRAGVGTGTVSRHFPTKEDLFAAILLDRMEILGARADTLTADHDPATAFFRFFALVVHEGAAHRGLAEALVGAPLEGAARLADRSVASRLTAMLVHAQRAGAVRADLTYPDVKALMTGCLSREPATAALDRLITVVCEGMRARPS